jgi:hypothetical protein
MSSKTDSIDHLFSRLWFQYVLEHPEKPWSWSALSNNLNVTPELVAAYPDNPWHHELVQFKIDKSFFGLEISEYSWDSVKDTDDENVDWYWVSIHPSLTWDIVKQNLHRPWDWSQLSRQSFIHWSIVDENPDLPWDWTALSENSMLDLKATFLHMMIASQIVNYLKRMLCTFMPEEEATNLLETSFSEIMQQTEFHDAQKTYSK